MLGIVGLFIKGTAKWPAITGLALSVVGAVIGAVVGTIILISSIATTLPTTAPEPTVTTSEVPSEAPSEAPSEEPSEEPTEAAPSGERPTVEEVEAGLRALMEDAGTADIYNDEQYTCTAQFFVDSDIPDDKLAIIAQGPDATYNDIDAALEFTEKFADSLTHCLS